MNESAESKKNVAESKNDAKREKMVVPKDKALMQQKYTKSDLEKVAKSHFGVEPECVTAAFFNAGIEEISEEDAKDMISDFLKREVN